jgi:hypothetical protein
MSVFDNRADHGAEAMRVGTPDHDVNDVETNAIDTIANVLLAASREQGVGEPRLRSILETAFMHAAEEIADERAAIREYGR